MGASCWHEFTPYDPDPEAALQRLRQEVFAAGRYDEHYLAGREKNARLWRAMEDGTDADLSGDERAVLKAMRAVLRRAPRGLRALMEAELGAEARRVAAGSRPAPQSIDDLLEEAAEEGTHSILDITHVAPRREFGAARPLSRKQLLRFFGTTEPTRTQVAAAVWNIADGLGRWEAVYVVVHKDGRPDEYAFIGCSGD